MAVRVYIALYAVTIAGGQPVHCVLDGVSCVTISPEINPNVCLDVPGGKAYNGAPLWLSECIDGKDSQKWINTVDDLTIPYATDENFCMDALDTSDGTQLVLWECNGADSQNWDMDYDTRAMVLKGSSACWDFWEDQWNGQEMHLWQCNGLDNQKFQFDFFHTTPMPHPTSWHPGCIADLERSETGEECCSGCVFQATHGHGIFWPACDTPEHCGTLPWSALDSEMGMGMDGQVQDEHVLV